MDEEQLVDAMIAESLRASFKKNGLEGTEDVIQRVYSLQPRILERFMWMYQVMVWGKAKRDGE